MDKSNRINPLLPMALSLIGIFWIGQEYVSAHTTIPSYHLTQATRESDELIGTVTTTSAFYTGIPGTNTFEPFLQINKGTQVKVLEALEEYYKVVHRNMIGYVPREHMKVQETEKSDDPVIIAPPPADRGKAESTSPVEDSRMSPNKKKPLEPGTANTSQYRLTAATSLRSGPSSKYGVLRRFKAGDKVQVLDDSGQWWWKVKYGDLVGWAKAALLKR